MSRPGTIFAVLHSRDHEGANGVRRTGAYGVLNLDMSIVFSGEMSGSLHP